MPPLPCAGSTWAGSAGFLEVEEMEAARIGRRAVVGLAVEGEC